MYRQAILLQLQQERERRERNRRSPPDFRLGSFPQQIAFVENEARKVAAYCSRRAGKTEGAVSKLVRKALARPGSISCYITLTRLKAKELVWGRLKELLTKYGVGFESNETELFVLLPNGSRIELRGCANSKDIEKLRGGKYALVIIDETQSIRESILSTLLRDVLRATLVDYQGQLVLIGTPGIVPQGLFWRACTDEEAGFSRHHWTLRQNPYIPHADEELAEIRKETGLKEADPAYQREFEGLWVADKDSLVLWGYNPAVNDYDPAELPGGRWRYVVVFDIGHTAADAIAVLGWSDLDPRLWLIHEDITHEQTDVDLGRKLEALDAKYKPIAIAGDHGGGGRKTMATIAQINQLALHDVVKGDEAAQFRAANSALMAGEHRLMLPKGSQASDETLLIRWDMNAVRRKIDKTYHSDIWAAIRYGLPFCTNWTYEEPQPQMTVAESDLDRLLKEQQRERELLGW